VLIIPTSLQHPEQGFIRAAPDKSILNEVKSESFEVLVRGLDVMSEFPERNMQIYQSSKLALILNPVRRFEASPIFIWL